MSIKNDIHLIKKMLEQENQKSITKEELKELKIDVLEILKFNITDTYTKTSSIYQYKEKIILDTIEELKQIKTPIFGIDDKFKEYKPKYNFNNWILDKQVTDIINNNFNKLARDVLNEIKLENVESIQNLTKKVEDILYKNLSGLINEGTDKNIIIKLLKDGGFYHVMLEEEKMTDTKELQEAYIKATPTLTKRLNLLKNQYIKPKQQKIPLIWKIYGVSKMLEKITKKW